MYSILNLEPVCCSMSSFNSCPLSASSRGSFVSLHFLPRRWCHLYIWGYWYFSWKFWLQLELHLLGILDDIACIYIKEARWQYTALTYSFSYLEPVCCYFCITDYAKAFDCVDHNKLWKILKEMGIPDHLTSFLRNLYAGQEATVRTGHKPQDIAK